MSEKYKQISLFEFVEEFGFAKKEKSNYEQLDETIKKLRDDYKTLDFDNRIYYFGSIPTGEYIYSVKNKNGESFLCFETGGMILVNECGIEDEKDLLFGKEKVHFPALYIRFFDSNGNERKDIHYSNEDETDDRQKWIIDIWHMDKVSTNRIEPDKKPQKFCEIEFALPDYIEWLKNDIKTRDYTRELEGDEDD